MQGLRLSDHSKAKEKAVSKLTSEGSPKLAKRSCQEKERSRSVSDPEGALSTKESSAEWLDRGEWHVVTSGKPEGSSQEGQVSYRKNTTIGLGLSRECSEL